MTHKYTGGKEKSSTFPSSCPQTATIHHAPMKFVLLHQNTSFLYLAVILQLTFVSSPTAPRCVKVGTFPRSRKTSNSLLAAPRLNTPINSPTSRQRRLLSIGHLFSLLTLGKHYLVLFIYPHLYLDWSHQTFFVPLSPNRRGSDLDVERQANLKETYAFKSFSCWGLYKVEPQCFGLNYSLL